MPAAASRKESKRALRARATHVLEVLRTLYPQAATELAHTSPFELLVATVLSAQATDASVNQATPALFDRFPDAPSLAQATPQEVEPYIQRIGLFRAKARHLVGLAQRLVAEHGGEVPANAQQLRALPGVGWKTATVVLGAAFGIPGIAVDTHLTRLAHRLAFSQSRQPETIGRHLEALFPRADWVFVHHALILFGRYRCTARKPQCADCPLWSVCASQGAW